MNRWIAGFDIFVGAGMLGLWSMLALSAQIPEWSTAPFTVITHVSAEALTGLSLLAAGVAYFRRAAWAAKFALIAQGMLIYAAVQASGYYLQSGDIPFVVMFAVITAAAAAAIARILSKT